MYTLMTSALLVFAPQSVAASPLHIDPDLDLRPLTVAPSTTVTRGAVMRMNLSLDGEFLVYETTFNDFVSGPPNFAVILENLKTGERRVVNKGRDGRSLGLVETLSISRRGKRVAFSFSRTRNSDRTHPIQVALYDWDRDYAQVISATPDGTWGNRPSIAPTISDDGKRVSFLTEASNLHGDQRRVQAIMLYEEGKSLHTRIGEPFDVLRGSFALYAQLARDGNSVFLVESTFDPENPRGQKIQLFSLDLKNGSARTAVGEPFTSGAFVSGLNRRPDSLLAGVMTQSGHHLVLSRGSANGIFRIEGARLTPVGTDLEQGWTISGVSPDGEYLLIQSQDSNREILELRSGVRKSVPKQGLLALAPFGESYAFLPEREPGPTPIAPEIQLQTFDERRKRTISFKAGNSMSSLRGTNFQVSFDGSVVRWAAVGELQPRFLEWTEARPVATDVRLPESLRPQQNSGPGRPSQIVYSEDGKKAVLMSAAAVSLVYLETGGTQTIVDASASELVGAQFGRPIVNPDGSRVAVSVFPHSREESEGRGEILVWFRERSELTRVPLQRLGDMSTRPTLVKFGPNADSIVVGQRRFFNGRTVFELFSWTFLEDNWRSMGGNLIETSSTAEPAIPPSIASLRVLPDARIALEPSWNAAIVNFARTSHGEGLEVLPGVAPEVSPDGEYVLFYARPFFRPEGRSGWNLYLRHIRGGRTEVLVPEAMEQMAGQEKMAGDDIVRGHLRFSGDGRFAVVPASRTLLLSYPSPATTQYYRIRVPNWPVATIGVVRAQGIRKTQEALLLSVETIVDGKVVERLSPTVRGETPLRLATMQKGRVQLRIKGPNTLAKLISVDLTSTGNEISLTPGDVDGNNRVDEADLRRVEQLLGRGPGDPDYDARAHVSSSRVISNLDLDIVRQNLGKVGDELPK